MLIDVGKVGNASTETDGSISDDGIVITGTVTGPYEGNDTTLGRPEPAPRVTSATWMDPDSRTTSMTDVITVWTTGKILGKRSLLYICSGAGVICGTTRSISRREGTGPGLEES